MFNVLVDSQYYGKVDEKLVDDFRAKLKGSFPKATLFHSLEDQASELLDCIQVLSINAVPTTTNPNTEITDKLSAVTLK